MEEIWKDIKGYEGLYQVSNLGKVRSLDRYVNSNKNSKRLAKGQILKPYLWSGYPNVNLCINQKRKGKQIHRLVAEAFLPNPNNYSIVNHIDENPLNSKLSNLEWCTQKHNVTHSKHKMYKPKNVVYSNLKEKYIFKSKSLSTKNGKKYVYNYYRVIIYQLNFDCRYSSLEKAIKIRNEKLKELHKYYNNIKGQKRTSNV